MKHLSHMYCTIAYIFNHTCVIFKILVRNENNHVLINMKLLNLKYGSILKKHAQHLHYTKRIYTPKYCV